MKYFITVVKEHYFLSFPSFSAFGFISLHVLVMYGMVKSAPGVTVLGYSIESYYFTTIYSHRPEAKRDNMLNTIKSSNKK